MVPEDGLGMVDLLLLAVNNDLAGLNPLGDASHCTESGDVEQVLRAPPLAATGVEPPAA